MGTAVAQVIAGNGYKVKLWDYNPETIRAIGRDGENKNFLPGVKLSANIKLEPSMAAAVEGAQIIIIAVSSPYVRTVAKKLTPLLKNKNIVAAHVAKGLEEKTFLTMHEVIQSEFPRALRKNVVTVSGPSVAKEFVMGIPTAVAASGESKKAREIIRRVLTSNTFKVASSADYKGAGICSALKNVYAIAHGMCDGLRLTMNAKAFLLTVAVSEMELIVKAFGGKKETVYGLAGLGDLITTSLGQGRNRALGERICAEGSCEFIFAQKSEQTFEGVAAAKSIHDFIKKKKIKAPLAQMVYRVIRKGADPCEELRSFFADFNF